MPVTAHKSARVINKYTLLREKETGRIGQIQSFRLELDPRNLSIMVKFRGQGNPVCFTGLHNILDTFEPVKEE